MSDSAENIGHLDMNIGRVAKLALAAQEIADEHEEEVETAVLIVRSEEGTQRIYYLKAEDEVVGILERAKFLLLAGRKRRPYYDDDNE